MKQSVLRLTDDLHREFKLTCVNCGISMKDAIERAIKTWAQAARNGSFQDSENGPLRTPEDALWPLAPEEAEILRILRAKKSITLGIAAILEWHSARLKLNTTAHDDRSRGNTADG